MKNTLLLLALALCALAGPGAGPVAAQDVYDIERMRFGHVAVRVARDFVLRENETVHDVVVVGGDAIIDGHVTGDLTVVFGTLTLNKSAVVDQSLVVVGGTARVQTGALVRQNLAVVGGGIEGPADFLPGRDHIVIGSADMLERAKFVVPWVTQGLLMGRPIAPRVPWVWPVVFVFFGVSLLLALIFFDGVRNCAHVLSARPLRAFVTGLLVLLLIGPLCVILAASVIGLAVVPFLLCAVIVAWTIGKVGVAMWIGGSIMGLRAPETRAQALAGFLIGFAAICFLYVVPILGFIVWGLIGVIGLGAATIAFSSAYRRESKKGVAAATTMPPPPDSPPDPPAHPTAPSFTDETPYSPPIAGPALSAAAAAPAPAPPPAQLLFFPRAAFLDRAGAVALDCLLVVIFSRALDIARTEQSFLLLLLMYHVVLWSWKGTTVGGMILQVRVVRADAQPLRFPDALVRGLAAVLSVGAAGLGFVWILRDPERQAWHDKIAGTYVVKVPRDYALA